MESTIMTCLGTIPEWCKFVQLQSYMRCYTPQPPRNDVKLPTRIIKFKTDSVYDFMFYLSNFRSWYCTSEAYKIHFGRNIYALPKNYKPITRSPASLNNFINNSIEGLLSTNFDTPTNLNNHDYWHTFLISVWFPHTNKKFCCI